MRLSELVHGLTLLRVDADPEITGVTEDSRKVAPGSLFVAIPGTAQDGHEYVSDAVARGAAAVVVERTDTATDGVAVMEVRSARAALAELAARFHDEPATRLTLIGFTGTFGKTSTSEVLRSLLAAAGTEIAVLGSLGGRYGDLRIDSGGLTTPAPVELHRALRDLALAGASTVILEVTSHALKLERVRGLTFAGGLLAAIMPGEHTDFHRSYEHYVETKRLFLDYLSPDAVLAYDSDNRAARRIAAAAAVRRIAGFSLDGRESDLRFSDIRLDRHGATFRISGGLAPGGAETRLRSALLGRGHLRNVALALTYAFAAGVPLDAVRDVLASLCPLRRRMERYEVAGRTVLDDTAGHADSLQATFDVAAMLPHDNLAVVYAIRGGRGPDVNRANAAALANLAALHGANPLIVTASTEAAGPKDRVVAAEADAARMELQTHGCPFVWHDELEAALRHAVARTRPGDLLVLIGAQGMDRARKILRRL